MDRYGSTTARSAAGTAARRTGASLRTLLAGVLGATAAAALLLLAPPSPAAAHNRLIDSDPAAGATLTEPPQRLELAFAERLNPSYTTIAVTDAAGQTVETTGPEVDGTRCAVTFPQPLPAGTYTVAYRVVSRDGHPVQDSFQFTVAAAPDASPTAPAPPSAQASPPAPASPSAPPPATQDTDPPAMDPAAGDAGGSGGVPVLPVVVGAGLLVVAAGGGLLWWRRRAGPHGEAGV